MALTFISIRGTVTAGNTSYCKTVRDRLGTGVQVTPVPGGTASVWFTLADPALWGSDGSGATWEHVGTVYQFTSPEVISFRDRIAGIKVSATTEDVLVDIIGGSP